MLLDENKKLMDSGGKEALYVENPVNPWWWREQQPEGRTKAPPNCRPGQQELQGREHLLHKRDRRQEPHTRAVFKLKGLYGVRVRTFKKDLYSGSGATRTLRLKIQRVPERNKMPCEVLIPKPPLKDDGEFDRESLPTVKGVAEEYASRLNIGGVVQFERFGFCILHATRKDPSFLHQNSQSAIGYLPSRLFIALSKVSLFTPQ